MKNHANGSFPLAEMRRIVDDFFQPDPRFDGADYLAMLTIAYSRSC